MSRDDGFAVMDVSTSWLLDDKFTRLARGYPRLLLWCVAGYAATKAASWRHGKRMKIVDSLPAWLHYDPDGVAALVSVKLLDRTGRIPAKPWREWFEKASRRRATSRERWTRANDRRRESSQSEHDLPRGNDAVTASTVRPSVPTVRPSVKGLPRLVSSNGGRAVGAGNPSR